VTATAPDAATGTAGGGGRPPVAVLAIDGGNSKTDVALVAADGTLLALATGPGSNPQNVGIDRAMEVLGDLIRVATALAGLEPATRPVAEHAAAYLAGADLPVEEERLQRTVHAAGWASHTRVANDTFALLRAGSPHPWGVAVVCGAGINCVGVAPDGRQARFPSLGRISGDWGGGGDLGEEVLWWAVRSEDGRGPRTALERAAAAHFGLATVADLTEAVHFGRIPWQRLGELTPLLFRVAATGDPTATGLVERLADEVVVMAAVALRRLGLLDAEVDVVLGGGVLTGRDPVLLGRIEAGLAAVAPNARPQVTTVPPVVGAALLGLDRFGAGTGAERRLRASFDRNAPLATGPER
jgi:N-acetylglucosamine kinase-like BadF-type ATPase